MTAAEFRGFLIASPFRPFLVKTTDGDTHRVEHPDYAMISPAKTEVVIWDKDGEHFRHVAMNHIVALEPARSNGSKKPGKR
jgi:hypothetical protein